MSKQCLTRSGLQINEPWLQYQDRAERRRSKRWNHRLLKRSERRSQVAAKDQHGN